MDTYMRAIRACINKPRKQQLLMRDRGLWSQLCASLDVIEDANFAIQAYADRAYEDTPGAHYLARYGLLQAFFVQQDAVTHLQEALGLPGTVPNDPLLKDIREIRNDTAGHPTKRGGRKKGEQPTYHSISRITLDADGFQLLSYNNGASKSRNIVTSDLIAMQRDGITGLLTVIIDTLRNQERAHKEKFKMDRLTAAFPDMLDYYVEKMFEGAGKRDDAPLASASIATITQALADLRAALERRDSDLDTYVGIRSTYDLLNYPLACLKAYYEGDTASTEMTDQAAYIYVYFVRDHLYRLREAAQEIDDEYMR